MERILLSIAVTAILAGLAVGPAFGDEGGDPADAINKRLYEQLGSSPHEPRVQTVSGQLYLSKENIDATVISDALAALIEGQKTESHSVSIQREPRLNFEIHFKKNSAELTKDSHASLDELAKALDSGFTGMRFVLGGHTDQDGDPAINKPLSQARAESARAYLLKKHAIAPDRLVARGFGEAEPLREVEKNAQDKLYNRRVDLRPMR